MTHDEGREQVAAAARRLAAEGLVIGTAGNVSARLEDDRIAVTPTGIVLAETTARDVTVVDLDGTHVDGALAPTSELDLHLALYRRHGAGAVVHTHAPMATALACVLTELPCIHYSMLLLGGDVRVAPYRTFGTPELAEVCADALDGRTAALMASHGAINVGADVAQAVEIAVLLEWACRLYHDAARHGTPHTMTAEEREGVVRVVVERSYGSTQEVTR